MDQAAEEDVTQAAGLEVEQAVEEDVVVEEGVNHAAEQDVDQVAGHDVISLLGIMWTSCRA